METPLERLHAAWADLRKEGWQDILYAPKDGTEVEIIEVGSCGIHKAVWFSYGHDPLNTCGSFFVDGEWPSNPILFRLIKEGQ